MKSLDNDGVFVLLIHAHLTDIYNIELIVKI